MSARSRLGVARGWIRTDGRPFADTAAALAVPTQIFYPLRRDEFGNDLTMPTYVATGTRDTDTSPGSTCVDYTRSDDFIDVGEATAGASSWTFAATLSSCGSGFRLYCFGTLLSAPLLINRASGRPAFVTQAYFTPGGGVADADALCHSEALAAGLPGVYLALLATSTNSAASRFDTTGAPWVRTDGVAVANTAADLFSGLGNPLAGIDTRADGMSHSSYERFWFGSPDPSAPARVSDSCQHWTGSDPGMLAETGSPERSSAAFFNTTDYVAFCNQGRPLICLGQ